MSPAPKIGQGSIGKTRDEIEQEKIAAEVERREHALDEAALARKQTVELSPRERAREEAEKRVMLDVLRETRPPKPTADAPAPVSLSTRVKSTPESTPEPVAVEPAVIVPEAQLADAVARQRVAQEQLTLAQAEAEQADAVLVQAKADHAAALAEQTLQRHRVILKPALAAAQRQRGQFQQLFNEFGGAGRGGATHGILARYAKTLPAGYDAQRRERLAALYRQAGELMEAIRLGFSAATKAVEACEAGLTIGGTGDYAELRVELAGRECEAASAHDPSVVRAACEALIAAVRGIDGEPGPEEVVVYLDGPSRDAVKNQTRAEGVGSI